MNLINNNPYRILGLPITSTEREITKQINTLATYAEMGKTISLESDYSFLDTMDRTPRTIEEAKKQIEQNENKFLYSLFWFWKNNSVDELALEVLKDGDINKAISIWEKSVFANKNKTYKRLVLFDNLIASSSHFENTDNENHFLKKDGEEYLVERKKEDSYSILTAFCDLNFEENWIIECDTTWIDGVGIASYGIVFGRKAGSYYFFGIAASGSYIHTKYDDWAFKSNIDWKENEKFNKWGSNKLRIEKIDSTLKFYINNEFVDSWDAEPFFGQHFGFKVTKNQKVSFRNFKFSKLVEHDLYGEGVNVSSKNLSNIKNLSTLYLSLAITNSTFQLDYFNKAIALAKIIFSTDNIEDYSKLIAGEKYVYNSEKTLHFYINNLVDSVKNILEKPRGVSLAQFINAFSNFPIEATQFLNSKFVSKQIQNIDKEIENTDSQRKVSVASAIDLGKYLASNTKADLIYLKNILGDGNFQYQIVADKLSLAIVQCGIDAFNNCKTLNGEIDYPKAIICEESYLNEYEYAMQIAVTERVKEKAKDNLDSCKSYIENKHHYNCWFCETVTPDERSNFEITIYRITSRDFKGVKYQYVPIIIPRCSKCKNFHKFDFNFEPLSGQTFGMGLVGLLLGIALDILIFISGNAYSLIGKALSIFFDSSKSKIKDTSHSSIRDYSPISERISDGWQFEIPKA
jgi:hypothetical protein